MVQASGASMEEAEIVTKVLTSGSLRGIDSHGVRILPYFTKKRHSRQMKVLKETKATALLDAGNAWGPVSAERAMSIAIEKAKATGLGSVLSHQRRLDNQPILLLDDGGPGRDDRDGLCGRARYAPPGAAPPPSRAPTP